MRFPRSAAFLFLLPVFAITLRCAPKPARPPGPAAPRDAAASFTLVAIGDTGKLTQDLYDNALGVTREVTRAKAGQRALLFLGDNFYEYGLSRNPINVRERRYRVLYEDLFGAAMTALARDGCPKDAPGPDCPAGPVNYVHALAGNHDYYSGALAFAGVNVLPTGFSTEGNEYCRVRGLLTPVEREALDQKSDVPQAPPAEGPAAKPAKPTRPWHWRYHFDLPQHEYWPLDPAVAGGPEIHVIFFDSALIVRAAENCGTRKLTCPGQRVDEDDPENPLACLRAQAALCRLKEHLDSEKDHPVRWRILVAHHPFWTVGAHGGYVWSAVEGEAVWSNLCSKAVDPQGWFKNTQFDPEDECSHGWDWYVDQLRGLLKDRPPFDVMLAGHDHSLQLIEPGEKEETALARVQIVSGAGCKTSVVRGPGPRLSPRPHLAHVYTASTVTQGESRAGFVALRFHPDRIDVQFFSGLRPLPTASMVPATESEKWQGRSCFTIRGGGGIDAGAECQW
jgi:hypothetical protein